jgi:predicted DNA-binding ribbon-helix-helix protein
MQSRRYNFKETSMCEIYVKADPILYELRTRSIRIHGIVTSIRLENLSWDILARIASRDGLTTNQLICQLYDEVIRQQGKVSNFCSFLRVSCMRFLSNVALEEDKTSLLLKTAASSPSAASADHADIREQRAAGNKMTLQIIGECSDRKSARVGH